MQPFENHSIIKKQAKQKRKGQAIENHLGRPVAGHLTRRRLPCTSPARAEHSIGPAATLRQVPVQQAQDLHGPTPSNQGWPQLHQDRCAGRLRLRCQQGQQAMEVL